MTFPAQTLSSRTLTVTLPSFWKQNADAADFSTDDFFENDFADDEYAEVDSIFNRIDIDGNGSISSGELRAY